MILAGYCAWVVGSIVVTGALLFLHEEDPRPRRLLHLDAIPREGDHVVGVVSTRSPRSGDVA
jgi:hypothetical protein